MYLINVKPHSPFEPLESDDDNEQLETLYEKQYIIIIEGFTAKLRICLYEKNKNVPGEV